MSEPRYPYVHVDVGEDDVEEVSFALWELGALGVEERDASTLSGPEAAAKVTLVASFADQEGAENAAGALSERGARVQFVVGDDWREAYKAYFKPSRVGRRLVVRPSWEPFDAGPDDVVLTVDPGLAFGTGTHASTRLLLAELDRLVAGGERVLDVGCGTGILAIAALRLGAESAMCLDVEADAVTVSRENAAANGVEERLEAACTPVAQLTEQFPLVLANIQADVLISLRDALRARLSPGGVLLLSGILSDQASDVRDAFASLGCEGMPTEGEWTAIVLRRPSD